MNSIIDRLIIFSSSNLQISGPSMPSPQGADRGASSPCLSSFVKSKNGPPPPWYARHYAISLLSKNSETYPPVRSALPGALEHGNADRAPDLAPVIVEMQPG
jgi:hypothetical protein